jgi:hypothetical protein
MLVTQRRRLEIVKRKLCLRKHIFEGRRSLYFAACRNDPAALTSAGAVVTVRRLWADE